MSAAEPGPPASPVTDDTGCWQVSAAARHEELPAPDVVVIGGNLLDEDPDERVVHPQRPVPSKHRPCPLAQAALRRAYLASTATE